MVPGRALHRLASVVCCTNALTHIVEPALADFQNEYAAARRDRRLRILIAGYIAMVEVTVMAVLEFSTVPHDEQRTLMRMFAWAGGVALMIASMLVAFIIVAFEPQLSEMRLIHLLLGLPMMLPIALPVGLTLGIALAVGGVVCARLKKVILVAAIAVSTVSIVSLMLVGPMTGMMFSQAVSNARRIPATVGFNGHALTPSQLHKATLVAQTEGHVNRMRRLRSNYHRRWAMSIAAVVLALFVFAVKDRWAAVPRVVVLAACAGYFLLFVVGETLMFEFRQLPPSAAAWLPNVVFGGATALLHRS
jgi:hypothetical protein